MLFLFSFFWLRVTWNLSSPRRNETCTSCIGRQSLIYPTTRELPNLEISEIKLKPDSNEHVDQQELSFTAGGKAKWCSHFARQCGDFLQS